jgi:signal transduction histidine kinase
MKLLTKITFFFITIALLVLFVGGIAFYFYFRAIAQREVQNELVANMHHFAFNLRQSVQNQESGNLVLPPNFKVVNIPQVHRTEFEFKDTIIFDYFSQKYQTYRIIRYQTLMNGMPVEISTQKSMVLSDELIEKVSVAIFFLTLSLLLGIYLFNRFFLKRIWQDFFKTVNTMQSYNISKPESAQLPMTEIYEFNLLNQVFEKMTGRLRQDYYNLREFTENVSHEIQNPLAVIKSKVDILLQDETLSEEQLGTIASIQANATRLSNINKSLILLAKIDNNQFPAKESISLQKLLESNFQNYYELFAAKNIHLIKTYIDDVILQADPSLVNILLVNLLKNAVRHNVFSGEIKIIVKDKYLEIGNTGPNHDLNPDELFKRFAKASGLPDSLGLGLSIIKKICDYYHYKVSYTCQENYHLFRVEF